MMQSSAQATKLVNLYTTEAPAGRPQMFQDALTATIRWAGPSTTEAELHEFVQRQVALLAGDDMLTTMVREGWEALAEELGIPAQAGTVVSLAEIAAIRQGFSGAKRPINSAPRRRFGRRPVVAA